MDKNQVIMDFIFNLHMLYLKHILYMWVCRRKHIAFRFTNTKLRSPSLYVLIATEMLNIGNVENYDILRFLGLSVDSQNTIATIKMLNRSELSGSGALNCPKLFHLIIYLFLSFQNGLFTG